jgi:hypothetical protein
MAVMSSSASLSSSSSSTSISSTSRVSLDGSRLRSSIFSLSAGGGGGCLDLSVRCLSLLRARRSSSAAAIFSKLGISRSAHDFACSKSSFACVTSCAQSPSRSTWCAACSHKVCDCSKSPSTLSSALLPSGKLTALKSWSRSRVVLYVKVPRLFVVSSPTLPELPLPLLEDLLREKLSTLALVNGISKVQIRLPSRPRRSCASAAKVSTRLTQSCEEAGDGAVSVRAWLSRV